MNVLASMVASRLIPANLNLKMNPKARTDFLFSSPNFWVGFGSTMNLCGGYFSYNWSKTPSEADARAIQNDWEVVGEDLRSALRESEIELPVHLES